MMLDIVYKRIITMKFTVLAIVTLLSATSAFAHSGGTDASGCHAGSKPYHCH